MIWDISDVWKRRMGIDQKISDLRIYKNINLILLSYNGQ